MNLHGTPCCPGPRRPQTDQHNRSPRYPRPHIDDAMRHRKQQPTEARGSALKNFLRRIFSFHS